jgi:hypothetical protein
MAADVLRKLDSDILLLQEVRDYDVCERLAEAINRTHIKLRFAPPSKNHSNRDWESNRWQ